MGKMVLVVLCDEKKNGGKVSIDINDGSFATYRNSEDIVVYTARGITADAIADIVRKY